MLEIHVQDRRREYERQRGRLQRVNAEIDQNAAEDDHIDKVHSPDHDDVTDRVSQTELALGTAVPGLTGRLQPRLADWKPSLTWVRERIRLPAPGVLR